MIYFISDLHLEESRPDITGAFFFFLDQIQDHAEKLYILGDFFEAWVGDDENTPLQQQVKRKLQEFTKNGVKTFFMAGNRDFLVGKQFAEETGVKILEEPCIVTINNNPIVLIHGDSLCTEDHAYMKLRAMIRAPGFIQTFLKRPLADRQTTARQLREMSQGSNKQKSMDIMDVTPSEVIKLLEEQQVQTLLHGHTHRPAIHDLNVNETPARRIVLGDWDRQIWYARADGKHIELISQDFPANAENYASL